MNTVSIKLRIVKYIHGNILEKIGKLLILTNASYE